MLKREPVLIGVSVLVIGLLLAARVLGLSRDEILWAMAASTFVTGGIMRAKVTPTK